MAGGDNGAQPGPGGGKQAIAGILESKAIACGQAKAHQRQLKQIWGWFFGLHLLAGGNHLEYLLWRLAPAALGERIHIGAAGGGGNGQAQPRLAGARNQISHASAQRKAAFGQYRPVALGFLQVQFLDPRLVQLRLIRALALLIGRHALLAAGGFQQLAIKRHIPVPIHAIGLKCVIKGLAVGFFGLRQGAVHVKNQRLGHGDFTKRTRSAKSPNSRSWRISEVGVLRYPPSNRAKRIFALMAVFSSVSLSPT